MRYLVSIALILLFNSQYFAQDDNCWKCLISLETESDDPIDFCKAAIQKTDNEHEVQLAKYALAIHQMRAKQFDQALETLKNVKIGGVFFPSIIQGLKGDCLSELGKPKDAMKRYESAALNNANQLTSPYYLMKAYRCAKELGLVDEASKYIRTIREHFPRFSAMLQLEKYDVYDGETKLLELEFKEFSQPKSMGIGTIGGESVNPEHFNEAVSIANENARRMALQQGQDWEPVDETLVWKSFVEGELLESEYQKAYIKVDDDELMAFITATDGFPVLPDIRGTFVNRATGEFDREMLLKRIRDMQTSPEPAIRQGWEEAKDYYRERRIQEKYISLIEASRFLTSIELHQLQKEHQEHSISFVVNRYQEVEDDQTAVSEKDVKKFYDKHKHEGQYRNVMNSREIRFFDIPVNLSQEDSANFEAKMQKLIKDFEQTENDSLFVVNEGGPSSVYSSFLNFRNESDPKARPGFTYPDFLKRTFNSAKIGDVIGPYQDGDKVKIAKIISIKDKLMTVRHILISADENNPLVVAKAKKTTDSLMKLVTHDNFEQYVFKYSEDPGSNQRGGVYEDFIEGEMVKPFNDYSLNEPIGKIGYVQTAFGFHIMEVLDRKKGFVPNLAIITREMKPGQSTLDAAKKKTTTLLETLKSGLSRESTAEKKIALFETLATDEGYLTRPVNIQDGSPTLYGFTNPETENAILKLAFSKDVKVGDLISSPIAEAGRYTIVVVSAIRKEGVPGFNDVKQAMEHDYLMEQKQQLFIEQMQGKTLKGLVIGKPGKEIYETLINLNSPQISYAGFEPGIVGKVVQNLKEGQISKPLKGKTGVFVVRVDKTHPLEENGIVNGSYIPGNNFQPVDIKRALHAYYRVIDNRQLNRIGVRP